MKSDRELEPIGVMPNSSSGSFHKVMHNSESGGSIETVVGKDITSRKCIKTVSVRSIPELLIVKDKDKPKSLLLYGIKRKKLPIGTLRLCSKKSLSKEK